MNLVTDLALLAVSFVVILAGAELFTNGIEWLGKRHNFSEGMVGSVLAAVGTALPETMIPIIAILFVATAQSEEIGVGAILGAPFMLSTAAMFVMGVAVLIYHRTRGRAPHLNVDRVVVARDLRFFLGMYIVAILMGLPVFDKPDWLRIAVGIGYFVAYAYYVRRTAATHTEGHGQELEPLRFQPKLPSPQARAIYLQVFVALAAIIAGARLFVGQIEDLATLLGIPALILALIIAPLATELPEKFNSVIWIRQRKDTLAMGNVSGAMVFQSCIPVAVGIVFTPWVLTEFALASAVIAVGAGILMQIFLRTGDNVSGRELVSLGLFYAAFIVWLVAFPHSAPPPVH